jgi:hypothetical protein
MTTVQDDETTILQLIRDHIANHAKRLGQLGLAYEISIARDSSDARGYRSEALVEFSDENGPWDMLEFEVARHGRMLVSLDDVKRWLPDAFDSVISRRQAEAAEGDQTARRPN